VTSHGPTFLDLTIFYLFRKHEDIMLKMSCYRPGVAQRVPEGLGSQIFMTFGT